MCLTTSLCKIISPYFETKTSPMKTTCGNNYSKKCQKSLLCCNISTQLWFRLSYISSLLHSLHPLTAPDLQANRPISPRQLQSKKPFLHLYKNILLIPASCYWSVVIMFWCHQRVAAKTPIPQHGSVTEFLGNQNLISSYFKMLTKSFVMKPIDHVWSHISHGIQYLQNNHLSFATYQIHVTCCLHNR